LFCTSTRRLGAEPVGVMKPDASPLRRIAPEMRAAAVDFIRDWLPSHAKRAYLHMIRQDPDGWTTDPHFADGVFVEHVLRGNGLDEQALGVDDLDSLWPELLVAALEPDNDQSEGHRSAG
jgi:hypothetical protein